VRDNRDASLATLETDHEDEERAKFQRYDYVKRIHSTLFDHTDGTGSAYALRLNGTENEKVGLAKSLQVFEGDKIQMEVYAKYVDPDANNLTTALQQFLAAVASGTTPEGTVLTGEHYTSSTSSFPYFGFLDRSEDTEDGPKAYLNWLLFDENYAFQDGGYVRMTDAARETGTDVPHERLFAEVVAKQAGYMYIYLSNENEVPVEVFFDDFKVSQATIMVAQATDYGVWGEVLREQKMDEALYRYGYQGQYAEKDEETGWNHFELRQYDAIIGRWTSVDPKRQYYSPYLSMGNNPLSRTDPDGGDDVYFNKDGSWNRTEDRSWFFELFFGHRGFQDQGNGAFKSISFNDQADALKFGKNGIYGGIADISNAEVKSMVSEGIENFRAEFPNATFGDLATGSMQFGPLDYTGKVSHAYLTVLGGRAYNDQDFGNFLWGASMQVLNVSYGNAKLGSELNGFWNGKLQNGQWNPSNPGYKRITWGGDSAADQAAIRNGYSWGVRNFGLRKFTF
jgi:RHS repeat-associated protein